MTITADTYLSAGYWANRLKVGDELREAAAVHQVEFQGLTYWIITRYDDAASVLKDELGQFSKDSAALIEVYERQLSKAGVPRHVLNGMFGPSMVFKDPPDHIRLRKPVMAGFIPRRIAGLEESFRAATRTLVASLPVDEPLDVIERIAGPLPLGMMCDLLGVPGDERGELRGWVEALNSEDQQRAGLATDALKIFFLDLIERKRSKPASDLISDLAADNDDRLSDEERMANLFLLLNAGIDTTTNLIGNSMHWLLAEPANGWDRLVQTAPEFRADAITTMLHEVNRVDSAVHMSTPRKTIVPVEYGGIRIPADEIVLVSLLSANRDPRRFGDTASEFDPLRADAKHNLSFGGGGIHTCLGKHLGLMEARIVYEELLKRFLRARRAPGYTPQRNLSLITNGFDKFLVRFEPQQ